MNAADGTLTPNPSSAFSPGKVSAEYCDLLIIDEMLPCDFSPFRNLEYAHYLKHFESSLLVSTEGWHGAYSNLGFNDLLASSPLPQELKDKIRPFSKFPEIVPKLAYITFLANAWQVFPYLVERRIPFILQLYPGGQFEIDSDESDQRLRIIVESKLCKKVIVTQNLSRDYLLDKIGCNPAKIEFIYGGVYDTNTGFDFSRDKKIYRRDKRTLDVCFVAHRYGDDVKKKGYDQFVAIAKALTDEFADIRFHVVGDYTPDQIPLENAAAQIEFYGKKPGSFFKEFYPQMDIILSINGPSGAGAFDGFPTGACMEAGFRGVLNCISDPLKMNVVLTDGVDVLLVNFDVERTVERLSALFRDTDRLYTMARANCEKYTEIFNTDQQLWSRTKVVTAELLQHHSLIFRPSAKMSSMDLNLVNEYRESARYANMQFDLIRRDYAKLQDAYLGLEKEYKNLQLEYTNIHTQYFNLVAEYNKSAQGADMQFGLIRRDHSKLQDEYLGLDKEYKNVQFEYTNIHTEYLNLQMQYLKLQTEYVNLAASTKILKHRNLSLESHILAIDSQPVVEPMPTGRAEQFMLRLLKSRYALLARSAVARASKAIKNQ